MIDVTVPWMYEVLDFSYGFDLFTLMCSQQVILPVLRASEVHPLVPQGSIPGELQVMSITESKFLAWVISIIIHEKCILFAVIG